MEIIRLRFAERKEIQDLLRFAVGESQPQGAISGHRAAIGERLAPRKLVLVMTPPANTAARLRTAYLKAFGREPTEAEQGKASRFLTGYGRSLAEEGVPADRREGESLAALLRALLASNEFLYVD